MVPQLTSNDSHNAAMLKNAPKPKPCPVQETSTSRQKDNAEIKVDVHWASTSRGKDIYNAKIKFDGKLIQPEELDKMSNYDPNKQGNCMKILFTV